MSQVWFARVNALSGPGSRMTPVSREGWLVVAVFVAAMAVGALTFGILMSRGDIALGVILYAAFAILGGGFFLWASVAHGDRTRTALDYRNMRQGGPT